MSVAKLLEEFSNRDTLPVEVDDLLEAIRGRGITEEILFFHDIELAPAVMRGFLRRDEFIDNGLKRYRSIVTYGKSDPSTERLVCCKELLHILDPEHQRVVTLEQTKHLISKIGLPADLVDPLDGESVANDRIALLEAVAILLPRKARNIMYDKYMDGKISAEWIAEQAELPLGYVKFAMNGAWPILLDRLITRRYQAEDFKKAEILKSKKRKKKAGKKNSDVKEG